MTLAISVVRWRFGSRMPSSPPPTTTIQNTTIIRTTARFGSSRLGELRMKTPTIGAEL